MFNTWCSSVHLAFPSLPSTLETVLKKRGLESPLLLDLLKGCFQVIPSKRVTATDLLNHPWWKEKPIACVGLCVELNERM